VTDPHMSIAEVRDGSDDDDLPFATEDTARLIAAAPDLLYALIHLAAHCEAMEAQHPDYHETHSFDLRVARAVIAKATGES